MGCPAGYLHRDLKPANVLLTEEGVLKVGDLGQSRPHDAAPGRAAAYTHTVATRWYRAPELLLGSRSYGPAADMWAVGCIFAEMLGAQPQGSAEGHLLGQKLLICSPAAALRAVGRTVTQTHTANMCPCAHHEQCSSVAAFHLPRSCQGQLHVKHDTSPGWRDRGMQQVSVL